MDDGEKLTAVIRLPSSVSPDHEALGGLDGDGDELGADGGAHKIHVKVQQDGVKHAARFRISPTDTVHALLAGYCRRTGQDPAAVTLRFDGEAMAPARTLADYDIEDDYVIDAVVRH